MKVRYVLDESEMELLDELSETTGVDYEIVGNEFPMSSFIPLLKDLQLEIHRRDEKIEKLQEEDDYDPEVEVPPIHGKGISW